MHHTLLLIIPGILGGMINAIAGGGGILLYPALLATGVPAVSASATVSLAVFPGTVTAAFGYRKVLGQVKHYFLWLIVPAMFGALVGAHILAKINPVTFRDLSPWLILSAVVLLALQTKIHRFLVNEKRVLRSTRKLAIPLLFIAMFGLSIYGGFFGAGFGLLVLVVLGFSKLKNAYQMSAVKNWCGVGITVVAASYFAAHGLINWSGGLWLAIGTSVGGYSGSRLSQKISAHLVHNLTVAIGLVIAIVLLVKS